MRKQAVLLILVFSLVLLAGCSGSVKEDKVSEGVSGQEEKISRESGEQGSLPVSPSEPEKPKMELKACSHNANCTEGKLCIEGKCQALADFSKGIGSCEKECKFTGVEILTSDGETYSLKPGQGSYTAAGALDWTILSGFKYCSGEKARVPIKILKRNYGQVFSDEVILVKAGETSKVITHPTVKRIAFTLTVKKAEESCS